MNNAEYYGNAKIIPSLSALPHVGEISTLWRVSSGDIGKRKCLSVEMLGESVDDNDGYVIYKVSYIDLKDRFIDTDINIYSFTYAIKASNI